MTSIARDIFQARGYDLATLKQKWITEGNICDMRINHNNGIVMALVVEPHTECTFHESEEVFDDFQLAETSSAKQNFLSTIEHYIRNVSEDIAPLKLLNVILIVDNLKAKSFNEMRVGSIPISYFILGDVHRKMLDYKFQPQNLRVLKGDERRQFVACHPNYARELQVIPLFDFLARYMDYRHDDIVFFTETDPDVGIIESHLVVLQENVPFRNPERKKPKLVQASH